MKTREDIESYLLRLELPYEEIGADTWMINTGDGQNNLVAKLAAPVVVFRCKIMDVPKEHREELFHTLLVLNTTDLLHGAYGIEGDAIVLGDALELENLDFNEFQATVEDISLAVANHYTKLAKYRAA
ncbi:MAG TPA: hypothetical protein VGQ83_04490 [Polyangia bacterium]|jgi:hypothetical protein